MLDLCERAGQFVLVTELEGDGASAVDGELAAAVVSLKGDPGRRRATAAHELGHLVLGDEYSSDLGIHASRASRAAMIDAFAAELLLPHAVFLTDASFREPLSRERVLEIAARYRTSWSPALKQAMVAGVGPIPKAWIRSNPTKAEFLEALGWAPEPDLESIRVSPELSWRRYAEAPRAIRCWPTQRTWNGSELQAWTHLAQACGHEKLTYIAAGNLVDALRTTGARLPCTGNEFPAFATEHGLLDPD